MSSNRLDRFRGALAGTFLGDALGAPVEGAGQVRGGVLLTRVLEECRCDNMPADPWQVLMRWGDFLLEEGHGRYTDDTQLTMALAKSLLDTPGRWDLDKVAQRFGDHFERQRGYGPNAWKLLDKIASGTPWREVVASSQFPEGSYANGAAMRVAPVSLAFYSDPSLVARAAEDQARVTGHHHPRAVFGARAQALAVWHALKMADLGKPFEFTEYLELLGEIQADFVHPLTWIGAHLQAEPEVAACSLGTGLDSAEAVPTALWCFLSCSEDPNRAVIRAVSLGGDADTIAAMAGAISGAYHGVSGFFQRWLDALEQGERGLDYLLNLAARLAKPHLD